MTKKSKQIKTVKNKKKITRKKRKNLKQKGGESNEIKHIPRSEFNTHFNTDIVTLPYNIIAVGIDNNRPYVYSEQSNPIFVNKYTKPAHISQMKDGTTIFVKYWLNTIHKNINKPKYYFLLNLWDGHLEYIPFVNKQISYYNASENEYLNIDSVRMNKESIPLFHKNKYI